jgi:glycosyltransferase involved in cell wall biosynthesis
MPREGNGMRISIALAAYNGSAHIAEQLESFVAQTRQPDELIIVDDGSTDGTVAIVQPFADAAPFHVDVVANDKNIGYAQNFGVALSRCSGDLVFLSDQDDVWFPEKIETIVKHMERDSSIACCINDALLTDSELVPSSATKAGQIKAAGLPDSLFVMGCCVAVRRSLLDIALPIPQEARSHDDWLVGLSDCLNLTKRVPDILQYYRRHGSNVSNVYVNTIQRIGKVKRAREYFKRLLKRITTTDSLEHELRHYDQLKRRLGERRESCISIIGYNRFSDCKERTEIRCAALSGRYAIRAMKIHRRIPPIARLWYQGGYQISGGVPGTFKDLLATQSEIKK